MLNYKLLHGNIRVDGLITAVAFKSPRVGTTTYMCLSKAMCMKCLEGAHVFLLCL